jgi:hypothetical protein
MDPAKLVKWRVDRRSRGFVRIGILRVIGGFLELQPVPEIIACRSRRRHTDGESGQPLARCFRCEVKSEQCLRIAAIGNHSQCPTCLADFHHETSPVGTPDPAIQW